MRGVLRGPHSCPPAACAPFPSQGQKLRRKVGLDLKQNKPQSLRLTNQGFLESAWNLVETQLFSAGGVREGE